MNDESIIDFGEYIEFQIKRRFGIITLNRVHKSNSFTLEQLKNLKKALDYCQKNEKIKGVILTANGTSFSTGMDLKDITKLDYEGVKDLERTAASICNLLYNGKPSICAVNGRALGEGVVFTACCDYRITIKDSFFQMPEINSAIFPGTSCVILFSKIIGISWTKKILMFAEKIGAKKALEIGLIDEIVDSKEKLLEIALERAKFLGTKNQIVLNAIKLLSNHLHDLPFKQAYEFEKLGSDWYKFNRKEELLEILRGKFNWVI
ncbi:MAG: enoyl-CoA hydratase/isomerase family protein [Promethearchaeota archaeon]